MAFVVGIRIFDPLPEPVRLTHRAEQTISTSASLPNLNAVFHCAEQTIHTSGNSAGWSVVNDERVLTMSSSGASGCLRFISDTAENFIAAFGVDQNQPWCDIVPNLTREETALVIHPQYYKQPDRIAVREMHQTRRTVTNAQGRKISIDFIVDEGNRLHADLHVE